nr:MAG TPA: hypothetical protein [Caudoviricetes sp.]
MRFRTFVSCYGRPRSQRLYRVAYNSRQATTRKRCY